MNRDFPEVIRLKSKTGKGCLIALGVVVVFGVVLLLAGYWGLKKAANSIPLDSLPFASGSGDSNDKAPATGWDFVKKGLSDGGTTIGSILKGDLRFQVPDALWQGEVRRMFPIEENISDLVSVSLTNPQFVPDTDPRWLRLHLNLNARMLDGEALQFPGRLAIRMQIKLIKNQQKVVLSQAQLVEFSFVGEAGAVAAGLRDVLAESIQSELEGFEVFQFPEGGGKWAESGKGMVKDVIVENGGIVVIAGW